jgi:uncharacterized protein (DUF169 family)
MNMTEVHEFLNALSYPEQPFCTYYTDEVPGEGVAPKAGVLPSTETEAANRVDWAALDSTWSCVIGAIWRARRKQAAAYFDKEHFGCLGGAFYLGFLKPQLETIVYYVSTGIPGKIAGERYLESPEATREFFQTIDPRPAPARFCVFKPLDLLREGEQPEIVTFFARPEVISGLNQLATFVTNDFEVVQSPFGAGCSSIVTWPLKYLSQGKLKAVVGGWDPSERKYLKPDEVTFSVPFEMFELMVSRWRDSFLTTHTWEVIRKRTGRSRKAWGEG